MQLDKSTGLVLRYGAYASIAIIVVGLVIAMFADRVGNTILYVGIALLVLTPFFSIIVSALALYQAKDREWLRIALSVLAISLVGILVAFFI